MRKKMQWLVRIVLAVVLVVCLANVVVKKIDLARSDSEIAEKQEQIRLQKLENAEKEDLLSEENLDDFYKSRAEDDLGFGRPDEKVYEAIPGR